MQDISNHRLILHSKTRHRLQHYSWCLSQIVKHRHANSTSKRARVYTDTVSSINPKDSSVTFENKVGQAMIRILDIPFTGKAANVLVQDGRNVGESLMGLPEHKDGFARVFEFGAKEASTALTDVLRGYLRKTYSDFPIKRWGHEGIQKNEIRGLSQQWLRGTDSFPAVWTTIAKKTPHAPHGIYDSVSSLRCWASASDRNPKLVVVNVNWAIHEDSTEASYRPHSIFDLLHRETGLSSMANGTRVQFTQLLILDFLTSNIFLDPPIPGLILGERTEWPLAWPVLGIHSGSLKANATDVNDYVKSLQYWERALEELQELTDAIDFVADIVVRNYPEISNDGSVVPSEKYAGHFNSERIFTWQRICHQRRDRITRSIERLNRTYEAHNKALNIGESTSVKRLTILAAIFLPLSLSASILSMGNRLVNLHLILYDFVGVFVIIGSMAIMMLGLVRGVSRFKKTAVFQIFLNPKALYVETRSVAGNKRYRRWMKFFTALCLILYASVWSILVVSFVVGMVVSVSKGLKILGFGVAGLVGYAIGGVGVVIFSNTPC